MSAVREEILAAIHRASPENGAALEADYAAIAREYPASGALDEAGRLHLLEERLLDYGATVYRCAVTEIADAVAHALSARSKKSLVIPRGLPRKWLPGGFVFTIDEALAYGELDGCEGALTGCALAIALTGTIVLRHSDPEGRRALTLIPDYHLCVVRASQVVETVVEGMRAIARFGPDPVTTISGPSATSDIEMTRIEGVHGPRVLDVIFAGGQE
ncbi:MAG: LutC/YkgG family protein [Bryobacteraceae bacterium]